jgi:hypothetical protein
MVLKTLKRLTSVICCIVFAGFLSAETHNLNNRGDVEKLLFGDSDALLDFFFLSASDDSFTNPPVGVRITRDLYTDSYILSVKYVSNYIEASQEARRKHPPTGVSANELTAMTDECRSQVVEHNRAAFARQREEKLKLFQVKTASYAVNSRFVQKMYEKTTSLLYGFEADESLSSTPIGGYNVTFRAVADDKVLSLQIHRPQGEALILSELFLQIISDAQAGRFDEARYMAVLDTFEK